MELVFNIEVLNYMNCIELVPVNQYVTSGIDQHMNGLLP